ncbi:hypothetical protein L249_0959 [Ophiocordyceps polyrhachis-furcata BCC 54312]|uniref:Uncharacterized protein n=1 Tax=Ophiocordyceps polyrhachis-furcata BCC 54312 TaxID=1330021 RepID=A0A367LEC1_9HYPO|nr:hypothetical protein L249_0959 [Ophiocordyceps polyrhachis-furcata BCC 54312]
MTAEWFYIHSSKICSPHIVDNSSSIHAQYSLHTRNPSMLSSPMTLLTSLILLSGVAAASLTRRSAEPFMVLPGAAPEPGKFHYRLLTPLPSSRLMPAFARAGKTGLFRRESSAENETAGTIMDEKPEKDDDGIDGEWRQEFEMYSEYVNGCSYLGWTRYTSKVNERDVSPSVTQPRFISSVNFLTLDLDCRLASRLGRSLFVFLCRYKHAYDFRMNNVQYWLDLRNQDLTPHQAGHSCIHPHPPSDDYCNVFSLHLSRTMTTWTFLLAAFIFGRVQALPPSAGVEQSSQPLSTEGLVHLFDAVASKSPPIPHGASLTPIRLSSRHKVAIINACRHWTTALRPITDNIDLVCINDKSSLDQLESLLSAKASGLPTGPSIQQVNSAVVKSCLKQQNDQYVPDNFDVHCIEQSAIHLASERQDAKEAVLDGLLSPKFNSTSVGIIKDILACNATWTCATRDNQEPYSDVRRDKDCKSFQKTGN